MNNQQIETITGQVLRSLKTEEPIDKITSNILNNLRY